MFYIRYVVSPKFILYLKYYDFFDLEPFYLFTTIYDDCALYKTRNDCLEVIKILSSYVDPIFNNCEILKE